MLPKIKSSTETISIQYGFYENSSSPNPSYKPNWSQESESLYDWHFTANQFVLVTSPLRLTTSNFFQLNTCGYISYVTSSLTRGWVCRLQLLLALPSAVILRSESRILLTQIRDSPTLVRQVPLFIYPAGTGWPSYTHIHWVSVSSPPTIRRATVEVFEPASTWGSNWSFQGGRDSYCSM
jgi:hypothetical protein